MGKFIHYEKYSAPGDYVKSLEEIVAKERKKGKIVLTSGTFDLLLPEHISYLRKIKEEYKKENGVLFVNIDNDLRAKLRKGPDKPINKSYNRAFIISNLKGIDYVSVHPEEKSNPAFQLASIIKPDYLVQTKPWTDEIKKELKEIFSENALPELVEFERISELDFSKISLGQFIQFEQYENIARYREKLEETAAKERKKGNKIVLTSGSFDILNSRHVSYLNGIKEKYPESSLFVNVANDKRVEYRKGKGRPINKSYNRAFIISNLKAVDYATVHPEEKSRPVFKIAGIIKPDYIIQPFFLDKKSKEELEKILGDDYANTKQIRFSRKQPGIHTTDLVKKAMKFYSRGGGDFSEFTSIYITELSKQLKESRNIEEFYRKNPETPPFIETLKKLMEKPEKYTKIRSSLILNVLKLKKAWNLSSYDELNEFLSKLAEFDIPKFSLDEKKFDEPSKNAAPLSGES